MEELHNMKILCLNCKPDLSYFSSRGLNFDVEYKTISEIFPVTTIGTVIDQNNQNRQIATPFPKEYLDKNYPTFQYSIILVGWNPKDYPDGVANSGGYSYWNPMASGTVWANVRQDSVSGNGYAIHELHHLLCNIINHMPGCHAIDYMDSTLVNGQMLPYYMNDSPNDPRSNHAITWNNIKVYLDKLKSITYPPSYTYFKPSEIIGLKPELVSLLDKARDIAKTPFKITSGLRSLAQNASVGGVEGSEHISGIACDVLADTSEKRFKIIFGALQAGFTRIGVYNNHIHLGIGKIPNFTQNVMWLIPKD